MWRLWVIAYQSRKCHVRYNSIHLEMRDVRCLVSLLRAFCSSHLDNSYCCWTCFERDARCEKVFLETRKRLEIIVLKLKTNMHLLMTRGVTASVSARDVIQLQLVNIFFDPFYKSAFINKCTAHKQFDVQHFLFHSVVDAAYSRDCRGSAKRRAFAFFWKRFPRNTLLFNAFFNLSKCVKCMARCHTYRTMCIYVKIVT